jgi:tRNA nucleotidyltransferase (CCA-adding enzyme)
VRQSSIKQDLHRRDFTINSMALRFSPEPMGELIDYYNGERDLNQKQIRVLHSLSFVDDPTRMIRAVRFEQRLGFRIEPRTLNLLDDALPFLDRVTGERIRNEIRLILRERSPFNAFVRLQELGILEQILPQLTVDRWFEGALGAYQYARETPPWPLESVDHWYLGLFGLLTARLSPVELQAVGERLSISRAQMKLLRSIRDGYAFLVSIDPIAPPSSIVKELEDMDPVCWVALWAAAPTAQLRRLVFSFVTEWRHIRPSYDGNQLQALGVHPGPQMGHILDSLRDAWIDGAISTREEERRLLQQLIEQQ